MYTTNKLLTKWLKEAKVKDFIKSVYVTVLFPYCLNGSFSELKDRSIFELPIYRKVLSKMTEYKSVQLNKKDKSEIIKILGWSSEYKIKQCFKNAQLVAINNPTIKYVEGYISVFGFPVNHAWNVTQDGIVIDVTMHKDIIGKNNWSNKNIGELDTKYFGMEIPKSEVKEAILKTKIHLSIIDYKMGMRQ